MGANQNNAKTLTEKRWGSNFIESLPQKWRAGLHYITRKTPGVPNGTDPDAITGDVITSEVVTGRTNELEKNTTELDADVSQATLEGQELDELTGAVIPFTEHLAEAGEEIGDADKQINPLNPTLSEVKTIDLEAAQDALADFVLSFPGTTNLQLPDVLTSVVGVIEKVQGDGTYDETGDGGWSGQGSASLSIRGTGQASAAIIPDLIINIKSIYGNNIPTMQYMFFLPIPVTAGQVLGKLSTLISSPVTVTVTIASPGVVSWTAHGMLNGDTVAFRTTGALPTGIVADVAYYVVNKAANTFQLSLTSGGAAINTSGTQSGVHSGYIGVKPWPRFVPEAHTFVLKGERLSLSVTANANWMDGGSADGSQSAVSAGDGFSNEVGLTVRTIRIPPTIHGVITLSGATSDTEALTADASAYAATTANATRSEGGTVSGSITPTTLSATSGSMVIPSSGRHVLRINAAPFKYSFAKIECEVVNFADVPQ